MLKGSEDDDDELASLSDALDELIIKMTGLNSFLKFEYNKLAFFIASLFAII
jgi:hypothetical protein